MIVVEARTEADIAAVRTLIGEYVDGLGLDLGFQGFEAEMANLSGRYAPPAGALFLARADRPLGCVGVRPIQVTGACELKRLYVRAEARGAGAGRALVAAALGFAAAAGYAQMLLDTMPHMIQAQALYRSLGFAPAPPYQEAVVPGMQFFGRQLP